MNFTFFSSAHGTFSRVDHILGHKSSLSKLKKIETIPSIFSDHNEVRLNVSFDERESKWTLGDGDGHGGLACCDSWGCKESDTTEWLNWTELNWRKPTEHRCWVNVTSKQIILPSASASLFIKISLFLISIKASLIIKQIRHFDLKIKYWWFSH